MKINPIQFLEQRNGYDKEQVDSYIDKLTAEYMSLSEKYVEISKRYDDSAGLPAKTLENARAAAAQIVSQAQSEAVKMIYSAQNEVARLYAEKEKIISALNIFMNRMLELVPAAAQTLSQAGLQISRCEGGIAGG